MYIYIIIYLYLYIYLYIYIIIFLYLYIFIYLYIYICIYLYIYIFRYFYIFIFIYLYIHTAYILRISKRTRFFKKPSVNLLPRTGPRRRLLCIDPKVCHRWGPVLELVEFYWLIWNRCRYPRIGPIPGPGWRLVTSGCQWCPGLALPWHGHTTLRGGASEMSVGPQDGELPVFWK